MQKTLQAVRFIQQSSFANLDLGLLQGNLIGWKYVLVSNCIYLYYLINFTHLVLLELQNQHKSNFIL